MGSTSTQFISFHEIKTDETELFEDAWGFKSEFGDVIELLGLVKISDKEIIPSEFLDIILKRA
jgi:hypothetical protein